MFDEIKEAVAKIAKINYYSPAKGTQVKCITAVLRQPRTKYTGWGWMPIAFASPYLKTQEEKISTNELELLALVWAVDRFKRYLLGREIMIATDHEAPTSALGENLSNKTYQSRLTRWVDRLLPYQFKIIHIPGKDLVIVDHLSREPYGNHGQSLNLMKNS